MSQNVLLGNMTNVFETYIEAVFLQLSSGVSPFHLRCVSKQTIVIFSFKDWISPHQKEKLPNMWRAHIGPHTFSVSPPSLLFLTRRPPSGRRVFSALWGGGKVNRRTNELSGKWKLPIYEKYAKVCFPKFEAELHF